MKRVVIPLGALFLLYLFAWVLPLHPSFPSSSDRFAPLQVPSLKHPFGTNDLGHDLFSEFLRGARTAISFSLGVGMIAGILGVVVGLVSGYMDDWVGEVLMALADIVLLIPRLPFLIALSAFLRPSYLFLMFLLGSLSWPTLSRVVRSKVLQLRNSEFLLANRLHGFSRAYIMATDLLPNLGIAAFPSFLMTLSSAYITEASLSFLGLFDPSVQSWGTTLRWAFQRGAFLTGKVWWFLPPTLGILFSVHSLLSLEKVLPQYERVEMYG